MHRSIKTIVMLFLAAISQAIYGAEKLATTVTEVAPGVYRVRAGDQKCAILAATKRRQTPPPSLSALTVSGVPGPLSPPPRIFPPCHTQKDGADGLCPAKTTGGKSRPAPSPPCGAALSPFSGTTRVLVGGEEKQPHAVASYMGRKQTPSVIMCRAGVYLFLLPAGRGSIFFRRGLLPPGRGRIFRPVPVPICASPPSLLRAPWPPPLPKTTYVRRWAMVDACASFIFILRLSFPLLPLLRHSLPLPRRSEGEGNLS